VPYDHVVFKDQRQILVTYCLQLLLVLILYPIPEPGNGPAPKNFFRHFLGRLHRPQDFQFLVDGMTRILNQPVCVTLVLLYIVLHSPVTSKHLVSARQSEVIDLGTGNDYALLGSLAMQQALSLVHH
jgi:hypothetical protein